MAAIADYFSKQRPSLATESRPYTTFGGKESGGSRSVAGGPHAEWFIWPGTGRAEPDYVGRRQKARLLPAAVALRAVLETRPGERYSARCRANTTWRASAC